MKINWFSPVPPTKSSIALDTAAVLPALARRAEVTLWVHEPSFVPELESHARVRRYDPAAMPWDEINSADATFYHIGNEPRYHGPIWRVNRQHPGLVVLHDLNLQDFFATLATEIGALSRRDYLQMMDFYHPQHGRVLGEAYLAGTKSIADICGECPLTEAGIENALGVAVHTRLGCEQLARATDLPVAYVPLFALPNTGVPVGDTSTRAQALRSRSPYRIIIFGFLGLNRRLHSCLTALHELPERDQFHLDIYGTIAHADTFQERVEELHLGRLVTTHGFVSDAELNEALARSDLALNLRDPTMGEASASQLRIWQYGLPSLVTDIGWYATLPEGTVAKVRRDFELEDIQLHLREFLAEPERYREMGEKGRLHVNEHHTVEAYLDGLWELIDLTAASRHREAACWMADRAGHLMQPWFSDADTEVCLPRLAEAIHDLFDEPQTSR